ncbi:MAG: GNAT family N-acetyltransferase [Clostridia bacterium]|nr:GNAT family N-acetyltransferase [Clostridia bacterium]
MNGENLDRETALKNAGREFGEMLTDGPDTEDHFVMAIWDAQSGKEVGWIWYCYETDEDDMQQVFLCDFLIFEDDRRKGYASAALAEMERRAKADGCAAAALFAWDHNGPGAALYRKCGYAPEERDVGGVRMKKML